MNFLYISPEFPPNFQNFILQLARVGVNVFGIGEAGFFDLPVPIREALCWYIQCPLRNDHELDCCLDRLLNDIVLPRGQGGIDRVESHNEFWLRTEAQINRKLNLGGIRFAEVEVLKKKSAMKQVFRENGLPVARGHLVNSPADCLELARETGFPLILKPDEGVGASGVYRVDDPGQLHEIFPRLGSGYLAEEFIDAPMLTYDGLTDGEGRVLFENSLVYGAGALDSVMGADTSFHTVRKLPARLSRTGRRLVEAFNIRGKFFHLELFDRDRTYIPVEINARPPGGPILDMMNFSVDDDLYRGYAEMAAGRGFRVQEKKKYFVGFACRKNRNYLHNHEEILARYGERMVEHGENPRLYWDGMGIYRYIFRSPELGPISEIKDFIFATKEDPA